MDVKRYTPCNIGRTINRPIMLGKVGEINALRIEFDCEEWLTDYPDAAVELFVKRPDNDKYHPALGEDGYVRIWIIDERAVLAAGSGVIELVLQDASSGTRIKSATGYTTVVSSLSAEGEASDLGFVAYSRAQNLTEAQKRQARNNIGAGTGTGTGTGSGTDGFSPTIKVEKIDGGNRLTITDIDGTKVVDVMDGKKGEPGEDGRGIESVVRTSGDGSPGSTDVYTITYTDGYTSTLTVYNGKDGAAGEDGVSPTVAVETIDGGHRVTITSADSPKSFEVMDGKTGDPGAPGAPGEKGDAGRGISNIERTSGDGSAGTVDTYTIYYTDGTKSTYQVRNGADGKDGSNAEGGGTSVELDDTLKVSGKAADAKAVGDALNTLSEKNDEQDETINELKEANDAQDQRLTTLEQAGGITAPYLGELKRTAIYPCSTIYLDGDTTSMTKDVSVVLDILITDEYGNEFFRGKSETAWQGSGSLSYPNKNLSIKLKDAAGEKAKINVFPDYATHSYHLKCNYLDYSMVRNSVGAQLAHDFDNTVFPVDAPLTVKSIPVIVYLNGAFNGCYTLNYKQDDKLFGMDSETNPLTDIVYRSGLGTWTMSNFEYRGDANETAEMQAKLQTMMDFAANSDDATFTAEFENHFDLNNAINYWLYADIACATDSMINNWTVATWDGVKWYMLWYDLDIIFGLMENAGNSIHPNAPSTDLLALTYTTNNPIWAKLYRCFYAQIRERYWELREGIANPTKLVSRFRTFQSKWSADNIAKDRAKWTGRPNTTADVDDMYEWMTERFAVLDEKYSATSNVTYTITNSLTYAKNSNSATSIAENEAYSAQITANSGYELESVTVTMGGVDVTADVYADGAISIPSVTGDVVITAVAVATGDAPSEGLPTGYTRLSYLESSGTQYIDTGKVFDYSAEDELYVRFAVTNIAKTQILFGTYVNKLNSAGEDLHCGNQLVVINKGLRFDMANEYTYAGANVSENEVYDYTVTNGKIECSVTSEVFDINVDSPGIVTDYSMYLFSKNNKGTPESETMAYARVYEFYYKENGVDTIHLIPALDVDGVPCMYDLVGGNTLYNAGSGSFAYTVA